MFFYPNERSFSFLNKAFDLFFVGVFFILVLLGVGFSIMLCAHERIKYPFQLCSLLLVKLLLLSLIGIVMTFLLHNV